jgi:cytochrome c-type biogenesis protein CcmH
MLIWLLIASLSGCVVLGLLWPLAKPARAGRDIDDRDFYRGQLAEIERDTARGLLNPATADDAKIEAARRLLSATGESDRLIDPVQSAGQRKWASIIALVGVPVLALSLYAYLGSPTLPDQPLASRSASLGENPDFSLMIAKVEARLAAHPEDGVGWATIAPVYLSIGRYEDAIKAFSNAIDVLGETADMRAGLGEARMALADGIVTTEALADFTKALATDPANERAQYYLALATEQDGDKVKALALFQALYQTLPPNADSAQLVAKHIAALSGVPFKPAPTVDAGQSEMIKAMVERLDSRLTSDGSDLEGWLKLMRAYQVLGDTEKAKGAMIRANAAQSSQPDALAKIAASAKELGISN